jgi:hypothetical protein
MIMLVRLMFFLANNPALSRVFFFVGKDPVANEPLGLLPKRTYSLVPSSGKEPMDFLHGMYLLYQLLLVNQLKCILIEVKSYSLFHVSVWIYQLAREGF